MGHGGERLRSLCVAVHRVTLQCSEVAEELVPAGQLVACGLASSLAPRPGRFGLDICLLSCPRFLFSWILPFCRVFPVSVRSPRCLTTGYFGSYQGITRSLKKKKRQWKNPMLEKEISIHVSQVAGPSQGSRQRLRVVVMPEPTK